MKRKSNWSRVFNPWNLAWCLGLLAIFIGGALYVAHLETGETNLRQLLIGMVDLDSAHKEFWDRNPNLEFIRSYRGSNLIEVRVRDSAAGSAVLDRSILEGVQVRTSSCQAERAFTPAEIYPGSTGLVCFTLEKADDSGSSYPYRFAASFIAPPRAPAAGKFYQDLMRSRGMRIWVLGDDIDMQALDGDTPDSAMATLLRVAIRSYAGVTHVFLAASDALVAQRPKKGHD